jgi:hypothetical protein
VFFRIHRSAIVRLDRIDALLRRSGGDYAVRLKDGTELSLSRARREELERRLGNERRRHPMPPRLRRLLHRAVDLLAHSGHAQRQTGRRALHPPHSGVPLRDLRPARTAGGMREPAGDAGDVRTRRARGVWVSGEAGEDDAADFSTIAMNIKNDRVEQLEEEVARITGETKTAVILRSRSQRSRPANR